MVIVFLSVENERQISNWIDCLTDSNGKVHHAHDGILSVVKSFYEKLYTNKPYPDKNLDSYFSSCQENKNLPWFVCKMYANALFTFILRKIHLRAESCL